MKISAQFWMRLLPPFVAAALALFYIWAIHPATGFIGGLLFLLVGWAIPSIINLVLSVWIAWFFRFHVAVRVAIFVLASFLLGINTWLPDFFSPPPVPPVEASIGRPVPITPSTPVELGFHAAIPNNSLDSVVGPSPLGVGVGSDEGCMCMYFVYGGSTDYYWEFSHRMEDAGISWRGRKKFYFFDPVKSPNVIHFDINFTPSSNDNEVNVVINVYDGLVKTATYTQRNLQVAVIDRKSIGRRRPLLSANFYDYCISMLMHRNFWTVMFAKRISGNPTAPFSDFLSKALPRSP